MNALLGYDLLGTWITMVWAVVKLVQDLLGAVQDWRRPQLTAHR